MKILLYRPNTNTAFVKYDNPCEVIIPQDSNQVKIIDMTKAKLGQSNIVIAKYKLIKKYQPIWTSKKACEEIMVKLIVEELS